MVELLDIVYHKTVALYFFVILFDLDFTTFAPAFGVSGMRFIRRAFTIRTIFLASGRNSCKVSPYSHCIIEAMLSISIS